MKTLKKVCRDFANKPEESLECTHSSDSHHGFFRFHRLASIIGGYRLILEAPDKYMATGVSCELMEKGTSMSEEEIADTQTEEIQDKETSGTEAEDLQDQETFEAGTEETQGREKTKKQPALVINVQSWATPIVGVLMLVVGLLAGYFVRPLIPSIGGTETPVAAAPANPTSADSQSVAAAATQQPADLQEVMDFLIPQVRHTRGDPNAPVTLIEFSDFQ